MLEIIAFCCGALVMVLEMVGARVLAPHVGTSAVVWTSLIGVVLACLAVGAWLGGRLADRHLSRRGLAFILTGASLGSALAEQVCDGAEQTLRQMLKAEGLYLTGRFSPGYGDWPISVQPLLAQALDTPRRMGMCVTESFLMLPRKSVTAVLGVSGQPVTGYRAGCGHCALRETCEYRKRGQSCEG